MRLQDKIKGHKMNRQQGTELKMEDELPVPHHSGYVDAPQE